MSLSMVDVTRGWRRVVGARASDTSVLRLEQGRLEVRVRGLTVWRDLLQAIEEDLVGSLRFELGEEHVHQLRLELGKGRSVPATPERALAEPCAIAWSLVVDDVSWHLLDSDLQGQRQRQAHAVLYQPRHLERSSPAVERAIDAVYSMAMALGWAPAVTASARSTP